MKNDVDFLLDKIHHGHRLLTSCLPGNIQESFFRLSHLMEMERRGLRFLPKRVTKRAMRKMRNNSLIKELRQ